MAKEVKSIDVHPDSEQAAVNVHQAFGWEFHSTQEVTENYQERRGDDIYQVRTKKIKLTFQREKTMPNYAQLVDLERQYYAVPSTPPPVRFGMIWLIISAIGLIAYILPGVLIIIWRFKRYSKLYPQWEAEATAARENELDILNRAQALL
ncbi:MAG: hypothetical protein FWB91_11985 [Defluviitaleaceae bacterium]|nr:hypothetical protein [Defluviitaleaceae bacterium]